MIAPHGGRLVQRFASDEERDQLIAAAADMPRLMLNEREAADLDMIASGAMSPLEGFMVEDDYRSVCDRKRLAKGLAWPLPVTLALKDGDEPAGFEPGNRVALHLADGTLVGIIDIADVYKADKVYEAEKCLMTADEAHPGVQYLNTVGDHYVGGEVTVLARPEHKRFNRYRLDPKETRVLFKTKGWHTIVAFQTRNPIHRAHEYLTKCALEIVDALLIHPLVGETKSDDIPADVRMKCYETLLENYYADDRVALAVYPQAMRYAGPREAILHALIRKNYGITHIIIGRDHAGVGDYYGTYDAQSMFNEFEPGELGITPLNFEHAFWCKKSGAMASTKTGPEAGPEDRVFLSGTKVREMLAAGDYPPVEFTRPEVAEILVQHYASADKTEVNA